MYAFGRSMYFATCRKAPMTLSGPYSHILERNKSVRALSAVVKSIWLSSQK